eukprot:135204_1
MQQFKPNIIVVRSTKINKSHLDASESLTLIVRAGAGFNTIAVDEASNKGWMYSLFTLFMLIVFEMMMVKRRMSNMKMIRNMRTKPFLIYVYRSNRWERMSTTEIVPGDIISLVRSHAGMDDEITNIRHMNEQTIVPCDVLLLTGNCVVDEALLTGESAPQIKEPIDISNPNQLLDLKSLNKISLISGGTKIVASNFDNIEADKSNNNNNNNINNNSNNNIVDSITRPPNNGAVVRVLTTGFHTSQGELLRTILFSTSRVSVNNPEAFVFILILLCFAIVASGYVLYWGLKDETRSQYKLALNCIMIITSVVPPELPMELSLAVNNSMVKLLKQKIFCTEAFRIPFAGAVEVYCDTENCNSCCTTNAYWSICPAGWVFCSPAPCSVSTCHNNYCGHQGNGADDIHAAPAAPADGGSVGNCADVQKKVQVVVDMDMKVNVGVNMNKCYNGKNIFENEDMDMDMDKVNVVRKMECKEYVQEVKEMDMDKMDMDNM